MNIIEVMKRSKETGESFCRTGSMFIDYVQGYEYILTADELLAEDWVTAGEFICELTDGKWVVCDSKAEGRS